jgi:hypothetical protein
MRSTPDVLVASCFLCSSVARGLVLRLISLAIEALQEHETRIEEHGAECREQLGAPSSWLAGGPAQPSQPTRFSKDEGLLA